MLVLSLLYPVVFLFGYLFQDPLLMQQWHLPFWLALFIGNVASVLLLNWLVPRAPALRAAKKRTDRGLAPGQYVRSD